MHRCLTLAKKGVGSVAPNPMVGAVLVYNNRIIGEGYHQQYGKPHAEPNCIKSVKEEDKAFISSSTLYVSLEPCTHFGKTPPCVDLIIQNKIPSVVIGCRDPFKEVDGKGIEKLIAAGINVSVGIAEKECRILNNSFFTFQLSKQPYVILKWAQSSNGKITSAKKERLQISNNYSNRLVHQWRSEEAGILVGTNTALLDDPLLTTRLWNGPSPLRIVLDLNLRLPHTLNLFKDFKTIVFNRYKNEEKENIRYYQIKDTEYLPKQLLNALFELEIQSVIVEGGARLLQSFIDADLWNEARIITNNELEIPEGIAAPTLSTGAITKEKKIFSDTITYYHNHS